MKRTRILLADDHAMICAGLQKLLEPTYEVVGRVGDGRALLEAAHRLNPDLVLIDVGMPLMNGLDAGRLLKKALPRTKFIFITMNPDPDVASEALEIGASGYLLKNSEEQELSHAIHEALRGMSYVTPEVRHAMDESFIRNPEALGRPKHLTDRQREVLQMLAESRSMKEIGNILGISARTVRFHKHQIMEELSFSTNSELIQYAIKHAMISFSQKLAT